MNMNVAYAALVGTALVGSAAIAQQTGGAGQAPSPAGQQAQTQSNNPAPAPVQLVNKQTVDEWRAPKLIGVDVYGADNKKIGAIKDILINHEGSAQAVVIGVGGFLGIGEKDVAVSFHSVQWQTESRALPTQSPMPPGGAPLSPSDNAQQPAPQPMPKMTNSAETEASQGYPDKAMINMTLAQLKSAPAFQYLSSPPPETTGSGSQGAATQRPQPQPSKP
jgi:sporulation protein YlmC with PRC-barrel domain